MRPGKIRVDPRPIPAGVDGLRANRYGFAMESSLRLAAAMLFVLAGCAGRQPTPIVISSAGATGYALAYPEQLSAEASALTTDKTRTAELLQSLGAAKSQLKPGADRGLLQTIIAQANEAGRGADFAAANAEASALRSFWSEERGAITARVNGVAQKQITEAGCTTADVSAGVGYALKDSVDRQLERRLRAHNEAHRTLERNKAALGQANLPALQKLADDIAQASYLVNSGLVDGRDRVQRLLAEQGDVDGTLDDAMAEERALQTTSPASGAAHKASQQRLTALDTSRRAIPAAVASGEAALKDVDVQIENARTDYQNALAALNDQLQH